MTTQTIRAPVPGTFYMRASPGEPPYKEPGSAVSIGDTVGLIEVMKSFMPIEATAEGRLLRYLVESDETVDLGQAVCEIEV